MKKTTHSEAFMPVKGIFMACFVLVLHVMIIAALGLLVLFFRGIVHYMIWIFLIGCAAVLISGYLFYRRMKKEQKTLNDVLSSPLFRGQNVEVSFLGGLATFKFGKPENAPPMIAHQNNRIKELEDPSTIQIRELAELSRLLEGNLITLEEFNKAKKQIFKIWTL